MSLNRALQIGVDGGTLSQTNGMTVRWGKRGVKMANKVDQELSDETNLVIRKYAFMAKNLDGDTLLAFGHLVSTSNKFDKSISIATVSTSQPLLITMELRLEDEILQKRFWEHFKSSKLHGVIRSRIGAHFLRSNRDLI